MPTPQGKYWCWTLNNPTEAEKEHLSLVQLLNDQIQYLVYQLEEGSEQRTPHLQGYVEFASRVTRNQAKEKISQRCHIERRRGTGQEARQYCKKDDGRLGGPWEFGEFTETTSSRGSRTDLEAIRRLIVAGSSEKCIADEYFSQWCQYNTSFRKYRGICFSHRDWKTTVIIIVGPPGTGKSRWVMDNYPSAYWKQRSIWWDNYECHEHVVLDDFYGWLPYDVLLRAADRYPLQVETKGGQANFLAKTLIITSNNTPAQWYKNVNLQALVRRVTLWKYMGANNVRVETADYDEFCNAINMNFVPNYYSGFAACDVSVI